MILSKEQENYIEHEVKLRMHDKEFLLIEKQFSKLDAKLNWIIGIIAGSIIIPVILHYLKLV